MVYRTAAVIFIVFLCVSCATGPGRISDGDNQFLPLLPGAVVYGVIDIDKAQGLLSQMHIGGFNIRQAGDIVDKAKSAVLGLYPDDSPQQFIVVADGTYPSGQANISFYFSPQWKRSHSPSGGTYWHSSGDDFSIAINPHRIFISDGDPLTPPPGIPVPDNFERLSAGAAMVFWFDDPAPINRVFDSLNIPIQIPAERCFIVIRPAEKPRYYNTDIDFELPYISQSRGLVAVFSLARRSINFEETADEYKLLITTLFTNPPVQDGTHLIIHAAMLSETELPLLFDTFAVLSKKD